MAAIVFPLNPALAQIFTYGTRSWVWNGSGWQSNYLYTYEVSGGGAEDNQTIGYVYIDGGTV